MLCLIFIGCAVGSSEAYGQTAAGISYQGRILKPDGSPLEGATVQFRLQIRTPGVQNCLMFEELQTQDMRNSNGKFAITMNDGNGTRADASGFGLDRIFANRSPFTFDPATCSTGNTYNPSPDDGRKLVVYFKDETMPVWEPMPAQNINFVPYAMETKQIAGFGIHDLLRFNLPASSLKNTSPLSEAEFDKLVALIAGTSTDFERAGRLGGVALPPLGAGQAGQVLGWNGTAWETTDTIPANSIATAKIQDSAVTSAKIADGSVAGADLAANIVINTTGAITSTATISTSGTMTSNIATARDFRIYDQDVTPDENYISFRAPISLPANYTFTWPSGYGSANQVLTTDGTGGLTWAAPAAASQWSNGAAGAIYYNGGNVGIGTANPISPLHVGTGSGFQVNATGNIVSIGGDTNAALSSGGLALRSPGAASQVTNVSAALNSSLVVTGSGATNGSLILKTTSGAGAADYVEIQGGNNGATSIARFTGSGNIGFGVSAPTAGLHLRAGSSTANSAPLKLTSGPLLATPEEGAIEFESTTGLHFTIGSTRYLIPVNTAAGNFSNVSNISNVGGSITITPAVGNSVIINQSTVSTSSTTGALVVNGGVGIAGAINSTGNITTGGSLTATTNAVIPQIYGSTSASGNILIDGTSNATAGHVLLATGGGNVGVGTATPRARMDVVNNSTGATTVLQNTNASGFSAVDLFDNGGTKRAGFGWGNASSGYPSAAYFGTAGAHPVLIHTNNTPRISIDSTGNVGIGTTSPARPLHVSGPMRLTASTTPASPVAGDIYVDSAASNALTYYNGFAWVSLTGSGGSGDFKADGTVPMTATLRADTGSAANPGLAFDGDEDTGFFSVAAGALGLSINGTERARLSASTIGSVTSGGPVLSLGGTTQAAPSFTFDGDTNTGIYRPVVDSIGFTTNATEKMRIDPSGNVGIGTTSPAYMLDVSGDVNVTGNFKVNGVNIGGGGGLTNFTEASAASGPNATRTISSFTAANAATNVDLAIVPKGSGAIVAAIADNAVTGGNKRGQWAVDLQGPPSRGAANQVASGQSSVIAGGYGNRANGTQSSILGGVTNLASGTNSAVGGGTNNSAIGDSSFAVNERTTADAYAQTSVGRYNLPTGTENATTWVATDPLFVVGNGTAAGASRSNAMMVLKNGNVGIGTSAPAAKLEVAGQIVSRANTIASGASVDFASSNVQVLSNVGGTSITVAGLQHGGQYTVVIDDTTSRTYTFPGCNTAYFKPANAATTASTRTIYGILATGSAGAWTCYITWSSGYQ